MQWLFEVPWWLPAGVALIGSVLLYTGNARREKPLLRVGAGLVLLAIILTLVSYLVDTDREKVVKRTRQLVAAIGKQQWPEVSSLLHPDAQLRPFFHGRQEIVDSAQRVGSDLPTEAKVMDIKAEQHGQTVVVRFGVLSQHSFGPITSYWELEWVSTAEGWQMKEATLTRMGGDLNVDQVMGRIPHGGK